MYYWRHILLFFCSLMFIYFVKAQEVDSVDIPYEHHDHPGHLHEHHHDHHKHEVGVGVSPVYFVNENELTYGIHLHYIYNIPSTKAGIGIGYERIFDDHKHNSLGLIVSYRPVENLNLSLSPGIAFESDEINSVVPGIHFETAYEFELEDFHLGPVLEFAADKNDFHISLGIHIGFGF